MRQPHLLWERRRKEGTFSSLSSPITLSQPCLVHWQQTAPCSGSFWEHMALVGGEGGSCSRIRLDNPTFPPSQARRGIKISHLDTRWKSGSSLVPWNSDASFKRHPGFGIARKMTPILRHLSPQLHLDSITSGKGSILQSCREQPPKALHLNKPFWAS